MHSNVEKRSGYKSTMNRFLVTDSNTTTTGRKRPAIPLFMDGNDFHTLLCRQFYSFALSCLFSVNMLVAFISLLT